MDQIQTPRYISWFEPLLYVPAFTQKDFHYSIYTGLPTQGTSTEDLGNTTLEYTTPLSNKYNLYIRGKAQLKSSLHLEGWTLSQTTINLSLEGLGSKPHNHNHLSLEGQGI